MAGNEIREARERIGWTQEQLGTQVGVSGRTVGNWERGTSVPRNRLAMLRDVLNIGNDDDAGETSLRSVSDASLLAEIARRFDERRTTREAGEGNASPTLNRAGVSSAERELTSDPAPADPAQFEEFLGRQAARRGVNRGRQIREQQDNDAEQ